MTSNPSPGGSQEPPSFSELEQSYVDAMRTLAEHPDTKHGQPRARKERNHAYLHIRASGLTFHVDCPRREDAFMERVMKVVMDMYRDEIAGTTK